MNEETISHDIHTLLWKALLGPACDVKPLITEAIGYAALDASDPKTHGSVRAAVLRSNDPETILSLTEAIYWMGALDRERSLAEVIQST